MRIDVRRLAHLCVAVEVIRAGSDLMPVQARLVPECLRWLKTCCHQRIARVGELLRGQVLEQLGDASEERLDACLECGGFGGAALRWLAPLVRGGEQRTFPDCTVQQAMFADPRMP